jgi:hypothetical protein
MNTNLDGFNVKEITLYTDEDIKPGMAVMIAEEYKAIIPKANKRFIGVCTSRKGNYVTVTISGTAVTKCVSDNIEVGYNCLSGDGNGNIKIDGTTMVETLVLEIDKQSQLVKILL